MQSNKTELINKPLLEFMKSFNGIAFKLAKQMYTDCKGSVSITELLSLCSMRLTMEFIRNQQRDPEQFKHYNDLMEVMCDYMAKHIMQKGVDKQNENPKHLQA